MERRWLIVCGRYHLHIRPVNNSETLCGKDSCRWKRKGEIVGEPTTLLQEYISMGGRCMKCLAQVGILMAKEGR